MACLGNNYFLLTAGTTHGPELQVNGMPFAAGEFGNWTPIGAVQTATGFDVATELIGGDSYFGMERRQQRQLGCELCSRRGFPAIARRWKR